MPTSSRSSLLLAVLLAVVLAPLPGGAQGFPSFIPLWAAPEGVAVARTGDVYVSVREGEGGMSGTIWQFAADGSPTLFAELGIGMVGGLAIAPNQTIYAAMGLGPDQGVYRVSRNGLPERIAGTEQMLLPNALAFDPGGNLYVTESVSGSAASLGPGGIWRVTPNGEAAPWLYHELLTGIPGMPPLPVPIGANGIAFYHGDLYVANTHKGTIVRVGIEGDGSPGTPEVWATLPELWPSILPAMPDGLALDVHGNVWVAAVSRNAILRFDADDRTPTLVTALSMPGGAPLDTPASLAFGTGSGEQQNLFVTNLGMLSSMPIPAPPGGWPGFGLVKVEAGAPGLPLK